MLVSEVNPDESHVSNKWLMFCEKLLNNEAGAPPSHFDGTARRSTPPNCPRRWNLWKSCGCDRIGASPGRRLDSSSS